jgi:blue copper oxidase
MQFSGAAKGFFGNFPMVNGTKDPYLRVDPAWYRFRILGGTNARVWQLKFSNGMPFTLIGNDGGLLGSPVQLANITLAPGERVDVLVDFRGLAKGTQILLQDVGTGWDLLGLVVASTVSDPWVPPTTLSSITPLSNPVRTRTFTFDGMNAINGFSYDMMRVDFQVPLGDTELWRFSTGGNGPHPVHIHGASFQVQSRTGGRGQVYPWEAGWKDTVLLEDAETVEILIRFDHYRSLYLIHCHQLGHEDNGMMMNFEVV